MIYTVSSVFHFPCQCCCDSIQYNKQENDICEAVSTRYETCINTYQKNPIHINLFNQKLCTTIQSLIATDLVPLIQ